MFPTETSWVQIPPPPTFKLLGKQYFSKFLVLSLHIDAYISSNQDLLLDLSSYFDSFI